MIRSFRALPVRDLKLAARVGGSGVMGLIFFLMIVTLIGWHVAGWPGMLVTSIAKFGPSSIVTILALHAWDRFKDRPWRRYAQWGLVPVTAGIVAASAALIAQASDSTAIAWAITAVTAAIALKTRVHPLWLLAAGSLIGLTGFGQ